MYGLVNQAIEDLVRTNFGDKEWHSVKVAAGVEDLVFIDTHNYSDDLTFKLVHAASQTFMQSPEILLRLFGRHWIMYTGREGWHKFFNVSSTDSISFLKDLENMHAEVRKAMPESTPPTVILRQVKDGYELDYHSERIGLSLFFQGIIEGLVEYYDEAWVVDQIATRDADGVDRFRMRLVEAVLNKPPKQNAA